MAVIPAPRREAALFLPLLRQIVLRVFQEENWLFRDPAALRYTSRLEDAGAPCELIITLQSPVAGVIKGTWRTLPYACTHLMDFTLSELQISLPVPGTPLPLIPFTESVPLATISVTELPPPSDNTTIPERGQRVVDLT